MMLLKFLVIQLSETNSGKSILSTIKQSQASKSLNNISLGVLATYESPNQGASS
jgi:hypothetical protein